MLELMNGRPTDCTGRLPKEIRCYDLLDSLHVEYQRIDHEAANTMEACAAVDEALKATICKNLLLCNRQCTAFYLCFCPVTRPSRPVFCPKRSAPPDCPSRSLSTWKNIWTSPPAASAFWV